MACIEKIYSISVLVGRPICNAKCAHCAATGLRKQANIKDKGTVKNLKAALRLCHNYQGWSISLTSTGEPTLSPNSVTETLKEIDSLRKEGVSFPFVNLFTNGFEIVKNPKFRSHWLPLWKKLGLTAIAISIHSTDYKTNLIPYGVKPDKKEFPPLLKMIKIIKEADLTPRITLLLHKGYVDNAKKYKHTLNQLRELGIDMVTSWPILTEEGKRCQGTPSRLNMLKIRYWLWRNTERTLGHVWGGGVFDYDGMSVRLTDYVSKHKPKNDFIRQLVIFQDGKVAYSWFQKGAFCIK